MWKANPRPECWTLGDLRRVRYPFEAECRQCKRTVEVDPFKVFYPDSTTMLDLENVMKCNACGNCGAWVRTGPHKIE